MDPAAASIGGSTFHGGNIMSYRYEAMRPWIFSEEGVEMLRAMETRARACLNYSGAVMMSELMACGVGGDTFHMLTVADFLCEVRTLREITGDGVAGQDRVFVRGRAEK